eukprot:TRINITY_DN47073_c0_g1_i1.p1 TRINITY_DN47073_c0_g1~~TRINITY_DN47073_c0_g1_i1.p1  ORF type:complete len:1223 (+),score=416.15 TRINITY_DN47073_c0_g1_i1:94-3669(+)
MAATRKDALQRAAALGAKLRGRQFLGGDVPSPEDAKEFAQLLGPGNAHLARWCKNLAAAGADARGAWKAPQSREYCTVSITKMTKAEKKAAHTIAGKVVVSREKEVKREKLHKDCLDDLPDHPNLSTNEDEVLKFWTEIDAFRTSMKKSEGRKPFSFYDGPPFATGLPHYGHILAGTIKDVVCRWAHLTGHHVERRFGWDCHGLPIEFEIEKQKGIKSSKDIIGPGGCGIAQYNEWCREIVMRYAGEWETIVTRMARWIDFRNDYKTMNLSYMESVWWVFKQLWNKDLVYRGFKVMPYSWGCTTVLSNHEANMNYQDVSDPSVVVTFPWVADPSISFLAWTTTPWTLPSNLMLCVNKEMDYILIRDKKKGEKYILAAERLVQVYPDLPKQRAKGEEDPFEELEKYKGSDLLGREYKPLFDFFVERKKKDGCFRIVEDDYVKNDNGTGIVHQAPGFGEDDYRVCMKAGVIVKGERVVCPVDENGEFTAEVPTWEGKNIKQADKEIMETLKQNGRLLVKAAVKHSYPFCWRSDKPLIYKACPSWFVNVERIREDILASANQTRWVPDNIRTGRFTNLVKGAPDWAVSRSRYWGCPLPIWVSADGEVTECMGSVEDLEKKTGKKITDLHRHFIDDLTYPDPRGGDHPPMRRVPEVFDCWFESGSMPFAQAHYPFENKEKFEASFPADFIAEGLDQTRGWFNTLLVLSTAVTGGPCFRNLIVNGLVLAQDGKKMSKRLRNYPDPLDVVKKHCADALRLYLINSPVVHGQELRFSEKGVQDVVKDVLLPVYHSLKFFTIQHNRLVISGEKFVITEERSNNVMDRWVLAAAGTLVKYLRQEMAAYRLSTVLQSDEGVVAWVGNLTNWYVRMNRPRLKGSGGLKDWQTCLSTLFRVLITTAKVLASFCPYMAEQIWRQLAPLLPESEREDSVHYTAIPEVDESVFDDVMLRQVKRMQKVAKLVRATRDRKGIGMRKPVKEIVVIHREKEYLDDVMCMQSYIKEEVNTFDIKASTNQSDWVTSEAEPCMPGLGRRFKKEQGKFAEEIKKNAKEICRCLLSGERVVVCGEVLTTDEITLKHEFKTGVEGYEANIDGDLMILLCTEQDERVLLEGAEREFCSRVQSLRKHAQLRMEDKIVVRWQCDDAILSKALAGTDEQLAKRVNAVSVEHVKGDLPPKPVVTQETSFGDHPLLLAFYSA